MTSQRRRGPYLTAASVLLLTFLYACTARSADPGLLDGSPTRPSEQQARVDLIVMRPPVSVQILMTSVTTRPQRATKVSIEGTGFLVNGQVTNPGTSAEGLLFNSRMVQAIFDDENPETVGNWVYPDTGEWDPQRNTDEFVAMVPVWAANGLQAVTVNLQGGGPKQSQFTHAQPWANTGINPDGSLKEPYLDRLDQVLRAADDAGMVVILGLFYFGQDQRVADEAAVVRAVDNVADWIVAQRYRNVMVEIANENTDNYDHAILRPDRVHELIERVSDRGLLASTSSSGGKVPDDSIMETADYILVHGNGRTPEELDRLIEKIRANPAWQEWPRPIVFNEDSTDLDKFRVAVASDTSWGFYDQGENNYRDGYQSPPTNWSINTDSKKAFFDRIAEILNPRLVLLDTE